MKLWKANKMTREPFLYVRISWKQEAWLFEFSLRVLRPPTQRNLWKSTRRELLLVNKPHIKVTRPPTLLGNILWCVRVRCAYLLILSAFAPFVIIPMPHFALFLAGMGIVSISTYDHSAREKLLNLYFFYVVCVQSGVLCSVSACLLSKFHSRDINSVCNYLYRSRWECLWNFVFPAHLILNWYLFVTHTVHYPKLYIQIAPLIYSMNRGII